MIPGLVGPLAMRRRVKPADVSYLGHYYNGGSGGSISGVSFGAEASDRVIIAVLYDYDNTQSGQEFNTVTIGGVTATVYQAGKLFLGAIDFAVAVALVPAGTSGTVSWSNVIDEVSCEIYRATDLKNLVPASVVLTDSQASSKTINSLAVEAGGFIVAVSGYKSSALPSSTTWSGLTEDYRSAASLGNQFSATTASAKFASAQTPTITITYSPTDNITLAAFAFR